MMNAYEIVEKSENICKEFYKAIEDIALYNQKKVLDAFKNSGVSARHFSQTTGYGYDDTGRDKLREILNKIFNCEDSIASPLIVSGTHALTIALFGILRPGDRFLSITGQPYDTLIDVINKQGIGSLKDFNIDFAAVPLKDNNVDFHLIKSELKKDTKMVFITRSRGYEWRDALSVSQIKEAVDYIKNINKNIIIMVDNCYGEFVDKYEPTDVGADIMAGSFIKNIGGGLAPTGGYICGKNKYINLIAGKLTAPGIGNEVGSYNFGYQPFFQGIFMAPHTVSQAIKGSMLIGETMRNLGYAILPETNTAHHDIIKSIKFNTSEELIEFCRAIQANSPIDSNAVPYPWDMPGYNNQVIMAAGTFIQGASIELSCDAPIKEPFVAYLQGGLTYEHLKLTAIFCAEKLLSSDRKK